MRKIVFMIFMVSIVLIVAGCNNSNDGFVNSTADELNNKNVTSDVNDGVDSIKDKQMKLVANCDFLNESEVSTICGSDVSMTKDDEIYGPCTFTFANKDDHHLKLIYYAYPSTDNKERLYNYCLGEGEKVDDFVCADSSNNVYVYGDYYSISLGQEMEYSFSPVCSFENIKKLGKLVKSKIYS